MLDAALDVLAIGSTLALAKGAGGSPILFAREGGAIIVGQVRKSFGILFNVRRFSSVGINNSLAGVHKLEDVLEAGLAFVGNNAKKMFTKGGRFEGWESADGLKRFRPSAYKKNQGKFQSNFEQRTTDVKWDDAKGSKSNMHVNTDRGFDVEKI